MAEIKSTLDIIMEKAKKFSVSEEDKKGFRRQELEGKIRGLIQKYVDGLLDLEKFNEEVRVLRGDEPETAGHLIREEAIARIQPGESNAPLLEILSSTVGMDTGPIKKLLDDIDGKMKQERARREKVLREELRNKGISGSAVIPNLNADEGWRITMSEAAQAFKERLKSFLLVTDD
jgi:hypothetical protein